jgi:hypothetical protein
MGILTTVLSWVKKLSAEQYAIIAGILLFLALFGYIKIQSGQINSLKSKLMVATQNVAALGDTVRIIKTKSGQVESAKYTLMAKNISDLQKLNADLAKQVKDQPGQVHSVTNIETVLKHDTIKMAGKVLDSQVAISYKDSSAGGSLNLAGRVRLFKDSAAVILDKLQLSLDIYTGIIQDKKTKLLSAYAKCDYKGVTFKELNSVSFDVQDLVKPPSRFLLGVECLGIGVGIGLVAVPIYKLFTKK